MTTSREAHKRYNDSEKGLARKRRYNQSEHGRKVLAEWEREYRNRDPLQYAGRLLRQRRYKALRRRELRRERGQVQDEGRN